MAVGLKMGWSLGLWLAWGLEPLAEEVDFLCISGMGLRISVDQHVGRRLAMYGPWSEGFGTSLLVPVTFGMCEDRRGFRPSCFSPNPRFVVSKQDLNSLAYLQTSIRVTCLLVEVFGTSVLAATSHLVCAKLGEIIIPHFPHDLSLIHDLSCVSKTSVYWLIYTGLRSVFVG